MRTRTLCVIAAMFLCTQVLAGEPNADGLTFREIHFGALVPGGMDGPFAVAVSPDGRDVYAAAGNATGSGRILQFRRDAATSLLTFVQSVTTRLQPNDISIPARQLVVSPDGRFVFAAIVLDRQVGFIARFNRNLSDGTLTIAEGLPNTGTIAEGLHSPVYIAIAPDGRQLYVLNDQSSIPPFYVPSLSVVSIDPATGAMQLVQRIDRPVAGEAGYGSFSEVTVAPDGENVYVAGYALGYVEQYNRNATTGQLTAAGIARGTLPAFVGSVAISPDGNHAYITDVTNGFVGTLDRDSAGGFTPRPSEVINLPGASRIVVADDGTRVYITSEGESFSNPRTAIVVFDRDVTTGSLTFVESLIDGVAGSRVLQGPTLPALSPDGASYYLPAFQTDALAVFSRERPTLPCNDFATIDAELTALTEAFDLTGDTDGDALPDLASLALVNEAACSAIDDGFDEAITNAYLINRASVGTETEVYVSGVWDDYQHVLPTLLLTSRSMRTYLNNVFDPFNTELEPLYVAVECVGGNCNPANARDAVSRSPLEPFSGLGDPDADGFTNAEEWANVVARRGSAREFGVSALDATNDGTRAVSFSGSSSCFIATAAYGTPLAAELDTLRAFRDTRLLTNGAGSAFADVYYRLSPTIAQWIADRPVWRMVALGTITAGTTGLPWFVATVTLFAVAMAARRRTRIRER